VIYLIDASVYVFRAYYSMPPDMTDRDGNPSHAVFGFARFLGDLVERAQPHYIAVAFDARHTRQIASPHPRISSCSSSAARNSAGTPASPRSRTTSTRPTTSWAH
jgi:5'-3' exonuclease, N-terminal resolvase-like domain